MLKIIESNRKNFIKKILLFEGLLFGKQAFAIRVEVTFGATFIAVITLFIHVALSAALRHLLSLQNSGEMKISCIFKVFAPNLVIEMGCLVCRGDN